MNILFLAPQPIYSERGTPIAIGNILKVLSQRGDQIDLVTYHRGGDLHYENVSVHRIVNIPFIREIPPGFSWKKVACDFFMLFKVFALVLKKRYRLVHAVEEAVFIALVLKAVFRIPYVFDMDSHLSRQLVEQHPLLFGPFFPLLRFLEDLAVRNSKVVVPVCDALRLEVVRDNSEKVMVLWDVSLLDSGQRYVQEDLRELFKINGLLVMYIGNLESYQGIDLLLDSFALVLEETDTVSLIIIGGKDDHIQRYRKKSTHLGIDHRVFFLGPRPVEHLAIYLSQADILVSPRVSGNNTPMKIFSYLGAGKPLLATNLSAHTQIINDQVSLLARPTPESFSRGMLQLIEDLELRLGLGRAGKKMIEEQHTFEVFSERLNLLYDWLQDETALHKQRPATRSPVLKLKEAINPADLRIGYQPIVSLRNGKIVGFEALIRWQHPEYGLLYPLEFLPFADDTGQSDKLGQWVLREACQQLRHWEDKYPSARPLMIGINLSSKQFLQSDLTNRVDQVLEDTGLSPNSLVLEISGQIFAKDMETSIVVANQLNSRGVRLYDSTINFLSDYPTGDLKINPSFLKRVKDNNGYSKLVQKVLKTADDKGLDVIAVGVETVQHLEQIKSLSFAFGQGFYFSKPISGPEVEKLLASSPRWLDDLNVPALTRKRFLASIK
jgi:EAL domain-containing protein (putative c-di-GMP-specific phosphodiesterase class I)/glycosyltransferase involved in cell wall biosynthesis